MLKLDNSNIEKINLIYYKNLNNKIYSKLIYNGKTFNLMTKKKFLNISNIISYYCSMYRTQKQVFYLLKIIIRKKLIYAIAT